MENRQNLHLLHKTVGETPNQCILRFKKDNPEYEDKSMTYAGRLDPMAEGLLLVLSGEKIKEKEKYLTLPKTYEFEVLWGFSTDTADLLGLQVEGYKVHKVEKENVEKMLEKSVSKFEQMYPAYSSRPVSGSSLLGFGETKKPLFQWAREGKISEVLIPKHKVEIFEAQYIGRRLIPKDELLKEIISKVENVSGDFRQKEIIERWKEILKDSEEKEFIIDKISIKVSSGFYVRQFVSDLGRSFDASATTFHIKRTKIGNYELGNSGRLDL